MYTPHMLAVQAGQPIKIRNSDDTLHNIHPRPTKNAEFNIGQPRKGMETTKTFDKEEVMIPVGCDVHPWMRSYISVLEPSVLRGHQGGRHVRDQEPARRRVRGRGEPREAEDARPAR